eukprot:TRINITY_DN8526_c0_g1_i2.p1 TRINITY_DN8526_c0_g1~~TRINITY_DN8526_c0_g1_i2.p1  ORF type:complete len:274 (-),score=42.95 TRINITY_DN8526_c0_g1_i2:88-909(-)
MLPPNLAKETGNRELWKETDGLIAPLSTVLLQEMARFNILLNTMRDTLVNLQNAIQGLVVMSQDLDSMYYSLLNNQVPKLWAKKGYLSLKPLASWIKDLHERVKFMNDWLEVGYPNCYWLPGLFFPQGFLTGVLQTTARKDKIPIDALSFSFKVLDGDKDDINSRPADGVNIYGFFLEGASWDRKKKTLIDQNPGEMYYQMPVIYFKPTEGHKRKPADYECPVYKTSVRAGVLSTTGQSTNFVIAVELITNDQSPDFWILRGTALLCQLNEQT